jgi:hypothetical protein
MTMGVSRSRGQVQIQDPRSQPALRNISLAQPLWRCASSVISCVDGSGGTAGCHWNAPSFMFRSVQTRKSDEEVLRACEAFGLTPFGPRDPAARRPFAPRAGVRRAPARTGGETAPCPLSAAKVPSTQPSVAERGGALKVIAPFFAFS